jgi:hypothetical protein
MNELKTHKDFPNYKFSETGKVWSNKYGTYMSTRVNPNGYEQVGLINHAQKRKMIYIHRIIAELFVPRLDTTKNHVNHKNGNKTDNHYKNLEWCTPKENMEHAKETGLHNQDGTNNHQCKFDEQTIDRVFILLSEGLSQRAVGAILNMSQQHVSQIKTGKRR